MADDSLRTRIDRMIEDLVRNSGDVDAASLASILMAVQVALRADQLMELTVAVWDFVDTRRPARAVATTKVDA